ncbi:MAG: RuBisCO large subunit C-terminal-like domain-containing protein, partial [Caldilineaceae bacterium]
MADERLIVRYRFPASPEGAAARAQDIALEQSTELPVGFEPSAVRHLGLPGCVEALVEVAAAPGQWEATISLPAFLAGEARAAALINVLFGNTSMQP